MNKSRRFNLNRPRLTSIGRGYVENTMRTCASVRSMIGKHVVHATSGPLDTIVLTSLFDRDESFMLVRSCENGISPTRARHIPGVWITEQIGRTPRNDL